jgi:hypothetical protein
MPGIGTAGFQGRTSPLEQDENAVTTMNTCNESACVRKMRLNAEGEHHGAKARTGARHCSLPSATARNAE